MHQQIASPPLVFRRPKRRWKRWLLGGFLLLVAAGVAAFFALQGREKPIPVTIEKAVYRDITQQVTATGKIRPEVEVKISPEVAGEIVALPVVVGQAVKKGDLLVRIKPDNYLARVKQAEAALSAAQADSLQRKAQMLNDQLDLRRAQELFAKKLISESDFKAAETKAQVSLASYESSLHNIDVSRSSLDQAKDLLDKTVIYSPIDGTISVLSSEVGERVVATGDFAGTEVMRVANLHSMEARVEVNENDIVNVELDDRVRIQVDAYPDRVFEGKVKQIASTATVKNENTQQEVTNFEVRILVQNPAVEMRPGMSCSVEIETQTVHHVVSVPIQSVTVRSQAGGKTAAELKTEREKDQDGISYVDAEKHDQKQMQRVVFLRAGDVARQVAVRTGIADENYVQIAAGVKVGDEVITGSYTAISKELKDGKKVELERPKDTD
ncbi:MAG: efflux RND transporter periplasmic adaptor subunit [Verrucomicrobia bacterium]|nr:efflux RND transporter periplasmic adaptor subunit [Verrucomicrobiota bacterium]